MKFCKSITRNDAKIFVTNGNSILISNLDGTSTRALRQSRAMQRLSGLDFHNQTGRIYWADTESKVIYSAYENGSNIVRIITSGIDMVESIAVDWIGENLYWTDYVLQHIEVSKLDGSRRKIFMNVSIKIEYLYICFNVLI
jgi:low density lipoprotein-related protein 2